MTPACQCLRIVWIVDQRQSERIGRFVIFADSEIILGILQMLAELMSRERIVVLVSAHYTISFAGHFDPGKITDVLRKLSNLLSRPQSTKARALCSFVISLVDFRCGFECLRAQTRLVHLQLIVRIGKLDAAQVT